jgi:hypothetical protein
VCTSNGRCVSNGGGNGSAGSGFGGGINVGGASNNGSGGSGGQCANIDIAFEKIIPTIMLLIDQSSSMTDSKLDPDDDNSPNRWDALKSALLGNASVIKALQGEVRFGIMFYSGQQQTAEAGACLLLTTEQPKLNNFQAITDAYPANTINNTPTAESHIAAIVELKKATEPGPRFVILATDGNPDRCQDVNQDNDTDTISKDISVQALNDAFTKDGIGTFVIGVSKNSVDRDHLRQLALAGQGKDISLADELFYEVGTQQELSGAISTIVTGARPCSFTLDATITPDAAPKGTVTIDTQTVPLNDTNGWQLVGNDTVKFVGTACDQIKAGATNVSASFPCNTGGVTPKPR